MIFEAKSTEAALAANGMLMNAATPWHIIIDTITIRKRNLILIGVDEEVLSFRYIRRIRIDEHLVGSDIQIKVVGGTATAYCLSKKDCRRIKKILLDYNASHKGKQIVFG